MDTPLLEILFLLLLIILNGFFSMAEFAVVSARRSRLQQSAEEGKPGAAQALDLATRPDQFLATIQVGITLIGTLAGALGGATVARHLSAWLANIPALAPFAVGISVGVVVLLITLVTLVFGELVPKQIALRAAEPIAMAVAGPMTALARIVSPVVIFLSALSNLVIRILGVKPSSEPIITEEEINLLMEQGALAGVFETAEQEMVESIFKLGEERAGAIMTPRSKIDWIDIRDGEEAVYKRISESRRTRFPVAQDDLDNLLGILHTKDLLVKKLANDPVTLRTILRKPLFVPESMEVIDVLERIKQTRSHIAMVTDEYGTITGMVTSTDILEAIVGDLPSAGETSDPEAIQREDGSWLISGRMHIEELKDLLKWDTLPEGEEIAYDTAGGFVMDRLGGVPREGECFDWNKFRFEVVDMDGRRVDKLIISSLPEEPADD